MSLPHFRLLLRGSPTLVVLVSAVLAPLPAQTLSQPAPGPATLSAHQRLARAVYQQLVEINTADSVGSTTKAAEAMAARFRAAGFPAQDIRLLVPQGKPTKGNTPDRDLILALTADEEGGDANGVEWLIRNHKPLIDAAYALNEGGGGTLVGNRPLFHSVQAAEKVPVNYSLTVTNPGGHSSVPRPDNAIYTLAGALTKIGRYIFPVALNEVTRPFFAQTALVEPRPEMAAAMRAIIANPADSSAAATLSRDARYASMLRTTCVATRLNGGHAYNALPQMATANVNCRIVPTSDSGEVRAALVRVIGDTTVRIAYTVAVDEKFGASPSAVEPELLSAVSALTKKMWGDIPVIPTMSTGATDGRFLRGAGIPTYGVSGIFSEPGETNAHGLDEKLRVKSYYDGLAFLDQLVRQVSTAPRT